MKKIAIRFEVRRVSKYIIKSYSCSRVVIINVRDNYVNLYIHRFYFRISYLLFTLIQTVLLSGCPTPFSTLQEYKPSSVRETSSITRVPLGRLNMPPPANSSTGCQVPRMAVNIIINFKISCKFKYRYAFKT